MTDILNFDANQYFLFFLLIIRISGIFITAPIFSSKNVPIRIRVGLILILALIMFSFLPYRHFNSNLSFIGYFLLVAKELIVGVALGLIPKVLFAAIEFAGTIIGFQMGLGIVNVLDAQSDSQISIIASLKNLMASLLFVILDGHHLFLIMITRSYEKIPIGGFTFTTNKIDIFIRLSADLFIIGLKIGAPLIVALFLANVIMGLMARSVPQMNIFVVGFPFTIGMGLILLMISIPYMIQAFTNLFSNLDQQMLDMLNLFAK